MSGVNAHLTYAARCGILRHVAAKRSMTHSAACGVNETLDRSLQPTGTHKIGLSMLQRRPTKLGNSG